MMKLFVLVSIVMFSMIGIMGIQSIDATVCFGIERVWESENAVVFSGNVKSIESEIYDEPIYSPDDSGGPPIVYGVNHIFFDVHQMFKDSSFDTIEYRVSISDYGPNIEEDIEYLVFGEHYLKSNQIIWGLGCAGGAILEISNDIKNSDIYITPVDFIELLSVMTEQDVYDFEYFLNSIEQQSQSPYIQLQNNISPKKILCKEDLQLYFKNNYDSTPVCVKPSTIIKLLERGWGNERFIDKKPNNIIQINDSENYLKYRITDNSAILNASYNEESNSFIIKIDSTSEGNLTIALPRLLFDSCSSLQYTSHNVEFFVLINSEEMPYTIAKNTDETLTLSIPFTEDTIDIEIIDTCWS